MLLGRAVFTRDRPWLLAASNAARKKAEAGPEDVITRTSTYAASLGSPQCGRTALTKQYAGFRGRGKVQGRVADCLTHPHSPEEASPTAGRMCRCRFSWATCRGVEQQRG